MRLLLAEDDRIVRITVRDALEEKGYRVEACADGTTALQALEREPFDLVLTDVRMPGVDGLRLFRQARRLQPDCGVVLMTAYAQTEDAVAVMREGARDYVQKPFEMDELLARVGRVRDEMLFRTGMRKGRASEGSATSQAGPSHPILGESAAMRRLLDGLDAAAAAGVPVLLSGETGTGKDLCARTLHERSPRAGRPFVAVNCAALAYSQLETELFGQETVDAGGAVHRRPGRFESADGGTLYLDEVGELSPASQARLLRAIETRSVEPVGSTRATGADVRVVAATSRDLAAEAARGAFRRDLLLQLSVLELRTPALREHRTDLPILTAHFLGEIARRMGRPVPELEPDVLAALAAHEWPGNVRELVHALERAVALARGGPVRLEHLPPELAAALPAGRGGAPEPPASQDGTAPVRPLGEAVQQFEQHYIQRVLDRTGGHKGRTAALLGISRKSLWERLKEVSRGREEPEAPAEPPEPGRKG